MTPYKEDFVEGTLTPMKHQKTITPFGKGAPISVSMRGTIRWNIEDNEGTQHELDIPNSMYVPDGNMRLLSPQHWAAASTQTAPSSAKRDHYSSQQFWNRNILRWGEEGRYIRTIYNSKRSNVPIIYSSPSSQHYTAYQATVRQTIKHRYCTNFTCNEATMISDDEESQASSRTTSDDSILPTQQGEPPSTLEQINDTFTTPPPSDITMTVPRDLPTVIADDQELVTGIDDTSELMRWHYRLGHLSFNKMNILATKGLIPKKLGKVRPPKCACCIYGNMNRRPWRTKGGKQKSIRIASQPGECVSVDQMESTAVGFIGQLKGRLTNRRYKYATVFTDHYSRYVYVHPQSRLTSEETIEAKKAFEAHMLNMHILVRAYHADNGRFADNMFINHCKELGQSISYCGVNAHWQNGIAERMIRTLRDSARTQLLHAVERWPNTATTHLWPYALTYAAHLHNHLPSKKDGKEPIAKLSGVDVDSNLQHMHTFGCPVYALDNRLQGGGQISAWNKRARLGMYLGPSPRHARSVSLIMNINTGLVSPQFHVVHDEFFETIKAEDRKLTAAWTIMAGFKEVRKTLKPKSRKPSQVVHLDEGNHRVQLETRSEQTLENEVEQEEAMGTDDITNEEEPNGIVTRSGRVSRPPERPQMVSYAAEYKQEYEDERYYEVLHQEDYQLQQDMIDPIAFKASSDPDTMYYHEAIRAPDSEAFKQAIVKEINDHIEGNHWKLIPSTAVPKGERILDSVWAMKRKRDIKTQQVYKHKARLNIHGGQQQYGTHYTDTYSPVVNWFSIRLLLIMAKLHNYATRQVDFVLAYPQADIPYPNYMKLPHGIKTIEGSSTSHVLQLKKNIYGGKNSGRVWYDYLKEGLLNIGFVPSSIDECVFYRKDVIFFFYVDDGVWIAKSDKSIDKAMKDLCNPKKAKNTYRMEDQGDITDYLGINFDKDEEGNLVMTQPHLINQIIDEVKVKRGEKTRSTPALSTKLLKRCSDEPSVECPFDYRKVIGKLNYLEKSSRPDIAYAVHQCARFCSDPKQEHIDAVIHLVKYLKGTSTQGVLLRPHDQSFEVWVDADFSGNWNVNTGVADPSTAKSRSGYVITYANCPIIWASKLQTQIALSSCEAEYISLSQSLRDTLPIMNLMQELKDREFEDGYYKPKVHCRLFEDNTGALALATVPRIRPRTKHINLVYHHFREAVREGLVDIIYTNTKEQIGDMFTKPLAQNDFVKFRRRLLGW